MGSRCGWRRRRPAGSLWCRACGARSAAPACRCRGPAPGGTRRGSGHRTAGQAVTRSATVKANGSTPGSSRRSRASCVGVGAELASERAEPRGSGRSAGGGWRCRPARASTARSARARREVVRGEAVVRSRTARRGRAGRRRPARSLGLSGSGALQAGHRAPRAGQSQLPPTGACGDRLTGLPAFPGVPPCWLGPRLELRPSGRFPGGFHPI